MTTVALPTILKNETLTGIVREFLEPPEYMGPDIFPEREILTDKVTWDVMTGSRKMANFVVRGAPAHIVPMMSYTRKIALTATIKEKKIIDAQALYFLRRPGSDDTTRYGEMLVTEEINDLRRRVDARREWTRWQALQGTLTVNQDDVKFSIDYEFDVTHTPTVAISWSDNTNARIKSDIWAWRQLIAEDSGSPVTDIYLNSNVMDHMTSNAELKTFMGDTMKDQILRDGYITRLLGTAIHVYDEGYADEATGVFQPYIPDDEVILLARGPLGGGKPVCEMITGASADNEGRPGMWSKTWVENDPAGRWLMVGWDGLPVINQPAAIIAATVIRP